MAFEDVGKKCDQDVKEVARALEKMMDRLYQAMVRELNFQRQLIMQELKRQDELHSLKDQPYNVFIKDENGQYQEATLQQLKGGEDVQFQLLDPTNPQIVEIDNIQVFQDPNSGEMVVGDDNTLITTVSMEDIEQARGELEQELGAEGFTLEQAIAADYYQDSSFFDLMDQEHSPYLDVDMGIEDLGLDSLDGIDMDMDLDFLSLSELEMDGIEMDSIADQVMGEFVQGPDFDALEPIGMDDFSQDLGFDAMDIGESIDLDVGMELDL